MGGATLKPGQTSIPRLVDLRAYEAAGIGHVMPTGRLETRHPCGEQVRHPRFAHPARERCIDCIERVGIVVPAPRGE
jgi:hypothetical protein